MFSNNERSKITHFINVSRKFNYFYFCAFENINSGRGEGGNMDPFMVSDETPNLKCQNCIDNGDKICSYK